MGLYKLVRSKGYKQFMAYLYGWGAAAVITGALFKITHWPGATAILTTGMVVEAVIFIFSSFEPLHVEYNWALVYPELAMGQEGEKISASRKDKKAIPTGTPTQQLDKMLEEAKIGPDLIESLATGMRNLSDNAKQLSGTANAVTATDGYAANLTKASESVRNLTLQYDKTADALAKDSNISESYLNNVQKASNAVGNLASIYEQTTKSLQSDTGSYNDQLAKLNQNLTSINTIYEMQAKNSKVIQDSFNMIEENVKTTAVNTQKYTQEIEKLTKNISQLSNVYGNMVAAMNLGGK
ncbi:gliding motility protein GldL [Bacteroidales bacterium OttesenSCG-928-B11]|nr:gliding motility protein GldL [Bacteroidales bacterium OttesenSCG-928-C03]MDL2311707.1 gliding motility protein GldL [Bacteroidales bacterium OttesenSCG-928-B11]MDL2325900.1 gliding motility protein GldL [Bacteroidales bacterium OttesenSCG-928-A14]